jgi:signal transduction histidine kinase
MAEAAKETHAFDRAGQTSAAAQLELLELGEEDRRLLAELSGVLSPHLEAILERWQDFLLSHPDTRKFLVREGVSTHLRAVLAKYLGTALAGPYDQRYFEERQRVGLVHARVELTPELYLAAYRKLYGLVQEFLLRRNRDSERTERWLEAFHKVVFLDLELALGAYFEASTEKIVQANARLRRLTEELGARNLELGRQYERSQEAARIKEEFLSRVSHELRTPLNAILGYADILIDGIDGEVNLEQERSLTKIRARALELVGRIEGVIDTAKEAAARIDVRPIDAAAILNRLATSIEQRAAASGLKVEARVEEDLPLVMGDEQALTIALEQLLDNALKFASSGIVRVEAVNLGESVRLAVADSGPGIPEEHREKVFAPFHQVEFGDTRTTTGLGVGLCMALQAVQRMGGVLQLVSSGPEGSTFAIELPTSRGGTYEI